MFGCAWGIGVEGEGDRNMAVSSLENLWCLGENSRTGEVLKLGQCRMGVCERLIRA